MKKRVLVLGCTGSIGSQTLDICRKMPDDFEVAGICAGKNRDEVYRLSKEFSCPYTVFSEDGTEGIKQLIKKSGADIAVNGIAGAAGLLPSMLVLENGTSLALANKETVVMAWDIVKETARKNKADIIPVDSEHSAVFSLVSQCGKQNIDSIVITASGGPFRNFSKEELSSVTPQMALKHPTWNMGAKITIDSATLANKGLEVIEAVRLFDTPPSRVKVVVHPQSLVHSLVRTKDGMLYAQISDPDMRHPIFSALTWPLVKESYLEPFDLAGHEMTFFPPRFDDFPLLSYAYTCAEKAASYTIAFNAANEIAVAAFLNGECLFTDIPRIVKTVIDADWTKSVSSIEDVLDADSLARKAASTALKNIKGEQS